MPTENTLIDPSRRVVEHGPAVGRYFDKEIPQWIRTGDGGRHEYSHVLGPNEFPKLAPNESVIHPGLVYKTAQPVNLSVRLTQRKNQVKVRKHESGVWRQGLVVDTRGGQLYVDFGGSFDWVCSATHEIVAI